MKSLEELRAIRERMQKQIDLRENSEDNIRVVVGFNAEIPRHRVTGEQVLYRERPVILRLALIQLQQVSLAAVRSRAGSIRAAGSDGFFRLAAGQLNRHGHGGLG